jgi:hypothetical protein
MSLQCLLRLTTRLTRWPAAGPVVLRHRGSGWFVAPEGATDNADTAVHFESVGDARDFVDSYTCEPFAFEVVPAHERQAAA